MRRVLARIDADALDRAIGAWLAAQSPPPASPPSPAPHPWRQAVAIDGKTLRGSGHHNSPQVHLLAVMDQTSRRGLAQTNVDAKTNEIGRFRPCWTGWTWPGGWSPPMPCTPNVSTPTGWSPSSTPPTC